MSPKVIRVHADGQVDLVDDWKGGAWEIFHTRCLACGKHEPDRFFQTEYAHNMNTEAEGQRLAGSIASKPTNQGTIVLVEKPSIR